MSILTYDDLRRVSASRQLHEASDMKKSITASVAHKVFLSHRHDDKDWVGKVVAYLKEMQVEVYIDSQDPSAPTKTSAETAGLIRSRIKECKKFIVLASPGSIDSKWIPWELGFADSVKGLSKVAVLPIGSSDKDWAKREYFGLYDVIVKDTNKNLSVFKPGSTTGGTRLSVWVNN